MTTATIIQGTFPQAKPQATEDRPRPAYLSCADTAKLIRRALKKAFPDTKFYVRSKTYSGGASIDVDWLDGPTVSEFDVVGQRYAGGRFDGMIDLKTHVRHWLLPDGTVLLAEDRGTGDYGGSNPPGEVVDTPPEGAKLVSLGADFVFGGRGTSRALTEAVAKACTSRLGWEAPEIQESGWWASGKVRGENCSFEHCYDGDNKYHPGVVRSDTFNRALWATSVRKTAEGYEAHLSTGEVVKLD